jgi:MarR family transcriptional regulator, organic hydroperoxide resistance regulator
LRNSAERQAPLSRLGDPLQLKQLTLDVPKQFRPIYGSVRHYFRRIEEMRVSGSRLWMLHELQSAPGIGVSELAHRPSIHQTAGSQLVEKLVARGHVEKTRSGEDQRRAGLRITRGAANVLKDAPGRSANRHSAKFTTTWRGTW